MPLQLRYITIMIFQKIMDVLVNTPKSLFDTGSNSTMCNQQSLLPDVQPSKMDSGSAKGTCVTGIKDHVDRLSGSTLFPGILNHT